MELKKVQKPTAPAGNKPDLGAKNEGETLVVTLVTTDGFAFECRMNRDEGLAFRQAVDEAQSQAWIA